MDLFTFEDLARILRQAAGESDEIRGGGAPDVADAAFTDLGYDSLALLEAAARIEREYGVLLADDAFLSAGTPRELIDLVNSSMAAAR